MMVYKDCVVFNIIGEDIYLYSNETSSGLSTVAEIGDEFHYLDSELPTIAAAIFAWQELNDITLTTEEIQQIMADNQLISQAV